MSKRIINENDFATLRLYEEDTDMHKIASAKIKEIFTRLYQNTEVNPDDFYFTIFEDEQANAFFIKKEDTEDKQKNVIAISRGLISKCENEAELAGIIAHECGHYLWNELLGGKNTHFQEVAADLRAVDLLMNGGYNPRNHLNVCKKVLTEGVHRRDITIDVHGNSLARVDYIEDYMTKIANEQGDFPPISENPDVSYKEFQKQVDDTYNKDGYNTWLERKLTEKYNTDDIDALGVDKVLTLISEVIDEQDTIIPAYLAQICTTINHFSRNNCFDKKTPETTKLCEDIFTKIEKLRQKEYETKKYETINITHCLSINHRILESFKLDLFGDFKKQQENIRNLCQSKTKEETIHWAKEMYKLKYTLLYAHDFNKTEENEWPKLNPLGKDNIGRKLPVRELLDYMHDNTKREELDALIFALESLFSDAHSVKKYSHPYYNEDEYFLDENGIVLYYGEEAKEKNQERKKEIERQKEINSQITCRKTAKEFYDKDIETINIYSTLALFIQEKDPAKKKELADILQEKMITKEGNPIQFSLLSGANFYQEDIVKKLREEFRNSEAFKYFIQGKDTAVQELIRVDEHLFLEDKIENIEKNTFKTEEDKTKEKQRAYKEYTVYMELHRYMRRDCCIESNETLTMALLDLAKYFEENGYKGAGVLYNLAGMETNKTYNYYTKKIPESQYKQSATQEKDGQEHKYYIDPYEEEYNRRIIALRQKVYRRMSRSSQTYTFLGEYSSSEAPLEQITMENFRYREKAELLQNVIKKAQIPEDRTKILHDYNRPEEYPKKAWKYAGIFIVADELRQGKDFDLKKTMESIRFCISRERYAPIVPDIFAKAIEERGKFEELSLQDKLYVYEVMEQRELFSEKYANKETFFKSIVKDIINHPNREEAVQIAEDLLSNSFTTRKEEREGRSENIDFLNEQDKLIDFYAQYQADKLGIDDGSEEYFEKISLLTDEILKDIPVLYGNGIVRRKNKFSQTIKQSILRSISDKVVSQELTAQMLEEKGAALVDGNTPEKYDYHARVAEAVMSYIAQDKKRSENFINFLTEDYSDESADKLMNFVSRGKSDSGIEKGIIIQVPLSDKKITLDKYTLKMVHENFWHADLAVRAVMMKSLLHSYSENPEELLNLTINMHFKEDSPYYKDANLVVKTVYKNLQDYEKDLILAALISANKRDKNTQKQDGEAIGEGLKMFFENKGPAFVKFGQLLSYLPQLSPEIRKPLAKLRDKADIPTRAEIFDLLKETLPDEELAKITRVDKVLGAGSFFITTKIKYNGEDKVVAIMRPHAKELAQSGMDMITRTINDLAKVDKKYEPLKNIAKQAKLSAMDETDIEKDYQKFCEAIKIYEEIKIATPKGEFEPHVARWQSYGSGKDGQVYKIIDMAGGSALTSSKLTIEQKHDMAVAYVTLELCNLLSGKKWDTDRHQGQQNFEQKDFSSFIIGIFDTGAQMAKGPNKRDKVFLGKMLYGMIRAARNGENITDYMLKKVKQIDKLGKIFNFDTLYIDDVQRGITALSDIITYQKATKDDKGNIITPEKSLTSEEVGQIATAILDSGLVDKDVYNTIKAKAILNKFGVFRKGWAKSLSEGIKKIASSISIEKREKPIMFALIRRKDKPEEEIEKLEKTEKKERKLGVSTKHISSKKDNMTFLNQIRARLQKSVS